MRRRPNAFWRFSLATYRDPAAAAACLALQDRWGADVNLLLFCCWLGQDGRALDKRTLCAAMLGVDTLQAKIIRPLRQSRRALRRPPRGMPKTWAKQLKDRIAAAEIDLEYVEHRMLFAAAKRLPPAKRKQAARAAIDASLSRYLTLLEVPPSHPDRRHANALLEACCPVAPPRASGSSQRRVRAGY
ncbi:MAG TPA: TIGR02444 family protein [Burkholderiaceae bacterium]|nr:TIGR02444 family protein [Burkholderiaceae bacterium]